MEPQHIQRDFAPNGKAAKVNSLVKKAFGKDWDGNWQVRDAFGVHTYMVQDDYLDFVARETFFSKKLLRLLGGTQIRIAAQFEPAGGDGSALSVRREYKEEARRYAALYEATFGKKATVNLY